MSSEAEGPESQLELLRHFARIVSIPNIDELLEIVIRDTPRLVHGEGCSVYLRPDYVPQFDGNLVDRGFVPVLAEDVKQDFIVLAATSRPSTEKLLHKGFYVREEGLTGWVFKHGKLLRLNDCTDKQELRSIAHDLQWMDKYGGSHHYYAPHDKKPILIVPLRLEARTIGVLKIPATEDEHPFSPLSEAIAVLIAQIVAGAIHNSWLIQEQTRSISSLVEIGMKVTSQGVFEAVTERLEKMLDRRRCQLYLMDQSGSTIRLSFASGKWMGDDSNVAYHRGQDLVGWVFKTSKPLMISNLREFADGVSLDDSHLTSISDGPPINEEDRVLKTELACQAERADTPIPFLAVPVKTSDGLVRGVLCVNCPGDRNRQYGISFNRNDLQLAQSFASIISVAIANEQQRMLGDLLTRLGYSSDLGFLFDLVAQEVPKLIAGTGCCIYELEQEPYGRRLRLVKSSRQGLASGGRMADNIYELGEGKTGFCGQTRATLVVNHYGGGKASRQIMYNEMKRLADHRPLDLIKELNDDRGRPVGIIQVSKGLKMPVHGQQEFKKLHRWLFIGKDGLPSPKSSQYAALGSPASWSFVAVPIKSEAGDLYGVITIGRAVQQCPFSPEDVTLLESIAGRLAAVKQSLEMQKQREQLLITLAHEVNTPLTGVLADTENLLYELPVDSELRSIAKHNLDQVLQLQLLADTILGVLPERTPAPTFSVNNLHALIKEACEMFRSEAAAKGCDILDPVTQPPGLRFPDIEMSRIDLLLAFKNLLHNAVKYSFYSIRSHEASRYVQITGYWTSEEREHFSVSIQNFGVGIMEEEIKERRIFEPYQRGEKASDRRRTGAGFGLAHARRIIEVMHHGTIKVESWHLSGDAYLTTFTVTLPVRQPQLEMPAA